MLFSFYGGCNNAAILRLFDAAAAVYHANLLLRVASQGASGTSKFS